MQFTLGLRHSPRIALLTALSLIFIQTLLAADPTWTLESTSPRTDLNAGVAQVKKQVSGPIPVTLTLIFFSESQAAFQVVANPTRLTALSISQLATNAGAIAACNGGYFHAQGDFSPVGLEVASGRRSGALHAPISLGGALVVRSGKAALLWDLEFIHDPTVQHYVHCNPWLINDGTPFKQPAGDKDARAARTFILTDTLGHWAIATSSAIGLQELSHLLLTPGIITEFPLKRALNLDGGPSTQIWWRDPKDPAPKPTTTRGLRNYILIVPK